MGNLNFTKNVFSGGSDTKIVGKVVTANTDGGRRSIEEIRGDMLKSKGVNIEPKQLGPKEPLKDSQLDMTRTRVQALKNINRN